MHYAVGIESEKIKTVASSVNISKDLSLSLQSLAPAYNFGGRGRAPKSTWGLVAIVPSGLLLPAIHLDINDFREDSCC